MGLIILLQTYILVIKCSLFDFYSQHKQSDTYKLVDSYDQRPVNVHNSAQRYHQTSASGLQDTHEFDFTSNFPSTCWDVSQVHGENPSQRIAKIASFDTLLKPGDKSDHFNQFDNRLPPQATCWCPSHNQNYENLNDQRLKHTTPTPCSPTKNPLPSHRLSQQKSKFEFFVLPDAQTKGLDLISLRTMLGKSFEIAILPPKETDEFFVYFYMKISVYSKNDFYQKILQILKKRREKIKVDMKHMSVELVCRIIFDSLEDDQVKIGIFFALYCFISRNFLVTGNCIRIFEDKLRLGREREIPLNVKILKNELEQFKRLNLRANTVYEAIELCCEIGNVISISSTDANRENYVLSFKSNVSKIISQLWIY
ncbi:hypothetical protein TUBRATIS_006750 [Tubulinosema ratisbonensis]|uniref:Cyclin N-terminal domain-containing protein n=1 Tax=Tubulinosema ratisbonensis TaxID=291195 RepID=A0A437AP43_9MICR|nr:hypothetical protein TUBRATIS_006750 [Tubulinosema ratisbonensis]